MTMIKLVILILLCVFITLNNGPCVRQYRKGIASPYVWQFYVACVITYFHLCPVIQAEGPILVVFKYKSSSLGCLKWYTSI